MRPHTVTRDTLKSVSPTLEVHTWRPAQTSKTSLYWYEYETKANLFKLNILVDNGAVKALSDEFITHYGEEIKQGFSRWFQIEHIGKR